MLTYDQITKIREALLDMAGAFTGLYLSKGDDLNEDDRRAFVQFREAQAKSRAALEGGSHDQSEG